MSYRPLKIHALGLHNGGQPLSVCGREGRIGSHDDVNCLRCLYLLGRYIPLVKLGEHQRLLGKFLTIMDPKMLELLTQPSRAAELYANERKHDDRRVVSIGTHPRHSPNAAQSPRSAPLHPPICPHCSGTGRASAR